MGATEDESSFFSYDTFFLRHNSMARATYPFSVCGFEIATYILCTLHGLETFRRNVSIGVFSV
ncbi:MAG: hypothetical protein BRD40_03685 [Bacteroidetes bacterium QS_1_65_9]|nr:MAG: hypothetical protein BRD40_03685 [Bacteroidetes bacterium QS_1_65_9]